MFMFSQHFIITNRPILCRSYSSELALNILHFLLKLAAASSNLLVSENEVVKTSEVEVIMFNCSSDFIRYILILFLSERHLAFFIREYKTFKKALLPGSALCKEHACKIHQRTGSMVQFGIVQRCPLACNVKFD